MFKYSAPYLVNGARGKVLDVSGGRDAEAQPTSAHTRHSGKNQHWKIIYLDQKKPAPTKGLNKAFGFYIDRPFILQSALFEEMYGCTHSNRRGYLMVRSNPPRSTMQYYFDGKTKTVISKYGNRNYVLEKSSSGNGADMYLGGAVNGRWW